MNAIIDGAAAAERQLTKLRHDPFAIVLTVGAPVVLVIIFGYIFGSAISVPGGGIYQEFLIPGLFATTAANILPSMVAMARDSKQGVVDRFRSMPIARTAVPFGQAAATALIGFQSAMVRSQGGMPPVGTKTLEIAVTGNTRIDACPAASSLPSTSPMYMPIQVAANWKATSNANAASA